MTTKKPEVKTEPATKNTSPEANELRTLPLGSAGANVRGTSEEADAPQTTVPATVDNGTATGGVKDPSPLNLPNPAVTNSPTPRTLDDMPIAGVGATPRELRTLPPPAGSSDAGLTSKEGKAGKGYSYPPPSRPVRDADGNITVKADPREVTRAAKFKEAGHTKCIHPRCHYPLIAKVDADRQRIQIDTEEGPGFEAECSWDPEHLRRDGSPQYITVESTVKLADE